MRNNTSQPEPLIALESFIGKVDGEERVIREGELFRPSDPAVKKWPTKFGPRPLEYGTPKPPPSWRPF